MRRLQPKNGALIVYLILLVCAIAAMVWIRGKRGALTLLWAIVVSLPVAAVSNDAESSLKTLDRELERRDDYIKAKTERIDSLRTALNTTADAETSLSLYMALGDAFSSFNNDSALTYYSRGYDAAMNDSALDRAAIFRLKRATFLPLGGFKAEAVREFDAVPVDLLSSPEQLAEYYEQGRQLFSYLASSFSNYEPKRDFWQAKSDSLRALYLEIASPLSFQYRLNYAEKLFDDGNYTQAKSYLLDILDELPLSSNLYARASHKLAAIALAKGDTDEAIHYLALSAAADTRGAVREVMSLQELGLILANQGDIDRAYNYISVALSNAVECQASLRIIQISEGLPFIQSTHNEQIDAWRTRIYIFIGALILITVLLIAVLFYLRRQMHKMQHLQQRLHSANHVKEVYMSQFLKLCSVYIDRLNSFCKVANRKISAGQIDELFKMTKSGKLVEEQSEEFYRLFDDAFLHIYPTFVDDVNKLLRDKIELKDGELLNNDLRILAFLRMGLEDTNRVAQILNYSVNTIYAYRNKLRNRAFDRDNFEKNIMLISSI